MKMARPSIPSVSQPWSGSEDSRIAPCQKPTSPAGHVQVAGLRSERLGVGRPGREVGRPGHGAPPLKDCGAAAHVPQRYRQVNVPVHQLDRPLAPLHMRPVLVAPHQLLGRIVQARGHQQGSLAQQERLLGDARGPVRRADGRERCDRQHQGAARGRERRDRDPVRHRVMTAYRPFRLASDGDRRWPRDSNPRGSRPLHAFQACPFGRWGRPP